MVHRLQISTWWPRVLWHIRDRDILADVNVVVSEISNGSCPKGTRDFYLAFAPHEVAQELCNSESVTYTYLGSGLHLGDWQAKIEPLVERWEGGANRTVQVPSIRFVRAFGLIPRLVDTDSETVTFWDDLAKPVHSIVRAEMVSVYSYPNHSLASVRVNRDYLLEYADRTNQSIIALSYEWYEDENLDETGNPYGKDELGDFILPGRMIRVRPHHADSSRIVGEYWGISHVYPIGNPNPGVTDEIPPLNWPGIGDPVTLASSRNLSLTKVFVTDDVLDMYEEHPEIYTVHPDSGGVSYAGQWSVSYCDRVGRDTIELELKKLYEGANAQTILHWHRYAIQPPSQLASCPNVAIRAKRIVEGILDLGDALSKLNEYTTGCCLQGSSYVAIDRVKIERGGWYDVDLVRPVTRRYPLSIGLTGFIDRCKDISKLVVEFPEKSIRDMLEKWGGPKELTHDPFPQKPLRGLKLLEHIYHLVKIANETGLALPQEIDTVWERYQEKLQFTPTGTFLPSPIGLLFKLYDIRGMSAHRGLDHEKLYKITGTSASAVISGWGPTLDRLYDQVGEALEALAHELEKFNLTNQP